MRVEVIMLQREGGGVPVDWGGIVLSKQVCRSERPRICMPRKKLVWGENENYLGGLVPWRKTRPSRWDYSSGERILPSYNNPEQPSYHLINLCVHLSPPLPLPQTALSPLFTARSQIPPTLHRSHVRQIALGPDQRQIGSGIRLNPTFHRSHVRQIALGPDQRQIGSGLRVLLYQIQPLGQVLIALVARYVVAQQHGMTRVNVGTDHLSPDRLTANVPYLQAHVDITGKYYSFHHEVQTNSLFIPSK